MKLINKDDYAIRLSDKDEIDINEMSEEVRNYYFNLYSLYMDLFIKYLIKKTKIEEYDNKLDSYNLRFTKCDEEDLDFYQNFSVEYLNFYYLRNNLYLYRLSNEENEFLKNVLISRNYEVSGEIIKFIENTYRKVIFEKVKEDEIANVNYATNNILNLAPNNSLVIGVRYNEDNELKDEEWMDNYLKQKEVLERDCLQLAKSVSEVLKCNCAVFEYTDESIKKKYESELNEKLMN